jgi:hypothetical protein
MSLPCKLSSPQRTAIQQQSARLTGSVLEWLSIAPAISAGEEVLALNWNALPIIWKFRRLDLRKSGNRCPANDDIAIPYCYALAV